MTIVFSALLLVGKVQVARLALRFILVLSALLRGHDTNDLVYQIQRPQLLSEDIFHSEAQLPSSTSAFIRFADSPKSATIVMVFEQSHSPHATPARASTSGIGTFEEVTNMASYFSGQTWSLEKENVLLGPYQHLSNQPGKGIREQLIIAFNAWLNVSEENLAIISKVVELLHTASLLYVRSWLLKTDLAQLTKSQPRVDDVEDSSTLRRGRPVAHSIFGVAQTVNSANYVYFQALGEAMKLNNEEVTRIYMEELVNLHRGQGMDLFWRDTLRCPTEDEYLEMVGNKTGGLFRLAVRLMQAKSDSNQYVPNIT